MIPDPNTLTDPDISTLPNGHLRCEECHTYWCEHIEKIINTGEDDIFIWHDFPFDHKLEVPIIPTANQWATCVLRPLESDKAGEVYEVGYKQDDTGASEPIWLGFIHHGEGRKVIRSMVLDWFIGSHDTSKIDCRGAGHGYRQTMMLKRDEKDAARGMAQMWSMVTTGKCLGCTFQMDANKDLVPPDDRYNPFS